MSIGFLYALALCLDYFLLIYCNYIPIILPHDPIINVNVGQTFSLECPIALSNNPEEAVKLEPRVMFTWKHESTPDYLFTTNGRFTLSKNSRRLTLVAPAQSSDAGVYTCEGVTGFGNRDVNIRVNVIDPHKERDYCAIPSIVDPTKEAPCFVQTVWDESHANLKREVGQSVEMDCRARGEPAPKYNWVKDKTSANWIDTATGLRGPVLHIAKLARVHTGHYTCRVTNVVGTINRTFSLTVIEPQNASPRILTDFKNRTEQMGDRAVFICKIACLACETPIVEWLKRVEPHEREEYVKANKNLMPLPNARASEENEEYVALDGANMTQLTSPSDAQQHYLDSGGGPAASAVNDIMTFVSTYTIHRVSPSSSGKYIVMSMDRKSHINAMEYRVLYLTVANSESAMVPADNLMVYIAVPIGVLLICTGILVYCIVRRCHKRCCKHSSASAASTSKPFRICNGGSSTRSTGPFLSGNSSSGAMTAVGGVGGGGSMLLHQQQQALLLNALANNKHAYPAAMSTTTFSSSNAGSHNNPVYYYANGMGGNEDSLMPLSSHVGQQSTDGGGMMGLNGPLAPLNSMDSAASVNGAASYYVDQYSSIAASSTTSGIYYPGHNSATSIHKINYPPPLNNNNNTTFSPVPLYHPQSQTLH